MTTIVNKLSEDAARDFLSRSTPDSLKVHIKGFSMRMIPPLEPSSSSSIPPTLLDFLVSCSYLIWDGDSFAIDSFTRIIIEVIREKYLRSRRKMKLLAFKFKDQERIFCNNWHGRPVLCTTSTTTGSTPVTLTINYLLRSESTAKSKYEDLGKYGLNFTKTIHIVAIGGGEVVGKEYKYTLELARSDPQRQFFWHIYPVCRIKADEPPGAADMEKCFWDNEVYGLKPEERKPGLPNFTAIIYTL